MKKKIFKIVSTILSIALITQFCPQTGSKASADSTIEVTVQYGQTEARTILNMINELRTGNDAWYWNADDSTKTNCTDLQPLTYDYDLEKVAMLRAAEIAVSYNHTRPNGGDCFSAYVECNYTYEKSCGENIAAGYSSASKVNAGWREDNEKYAGQGHRRNMLNKNFSAVGIGHVKFNGCDYWVEEFAGNTPQSSETAPNDQKENCNIKINENYITSVKLGNSDDKISLRCGETYALSDISAQIGYNNYWNHWYNTFPVNVTPDLSSQDSTIATYADGKVTGVSEGETTLIANIYGKEASISISVHDCSLHKVIDKAVEATTTEDGLTEGSHCAICNRIIEEQKVIPKLSSTPAPTIKPSETPIPTATPSLTPVPTVKPSGTPIPTKTPSLTPVPTAKPSDNPEPTVRPSKAPTIPEVVPSVKPTATPVPGNKKDTGITKNGINYKLSSKSAICITNVDKSKKTVVIPDVIKANGKNYKVTSIKTDAFKNCTKLSKVVIGKNIKSIEKNAFKGCKSLKQIVIKSTVVNQNEVKTALLSRITKKTTVIVPKSKYKAYKKIINKLGKQKKYIVLKK